MYWEPGIYVLQLIYVQISNIQKCTDQVLSTSCSHTVEKQHETLEIFLEYLISNY